MTNKERAKIFLPFDALKGYREALKKQEKIVVLKKDLIEKSDLDNTLKSLKKGMLVRVEYYYDFEYIIQEGVVVNIDNVYKYITVVTNKISFDDIYKIEILEQVEINIK